MDSHLGSDWNHPTEREINDFLALCGDQALYGKAPFVLEASTVWFDSRGALAICTPRGAIYRDRPAILQLYARSPHSTITIDTIPNLPRELLVYSNDALDVVTRQRIPGTALRERRYFLQAACWDSQTCIVVRRLLPGDLAAVAQLHREADAPTFESRFFARGAFVGAWVGDRCVGILGTRVQIPDTGECLIGHLYVARSYRRRGFGRALLESLCVNSLRGFCRIYADVVTDNEPSIHLFESSGFRPTETVMAMRAFT